MYLFWCLISSVRNENFGEGSSLRVFFPLLLANEALACTRVGSVLVQVHDFHS